MGNTEKGATTAKRSPTTTDRMEQASSGLPRAVGAQRAARPPPACAFGGGAVDRTGRARGIGEVAIGTIRRSSSPRRELAGRRAVESERRGASRRETRCVPAARAPDWGARSCCLIQNEIGPLGKVLGGPHCQAQ
jgi:hypothetical protein